jgi:hypothetical protein
MGTLRFNIFPIPVCFDQSSSCQDTTDSFVAPVGGTSFQWTVNLSGEGGNPQFDLTNGRTFFFEVFDRGTSNGFESQYINITRNAGTSSTTSKPTSTSSTKPTSTSSTKSTSSATNTNTTTANSNGLSKGAQAGIGVGVGIVGVALIIGAIVFFVARRRRAGETAYAAPTELPPNDVAKSYYGPPVELPPSVPKYAGQQPSRPISELPETPSMSAVSRPHEL